MNSSRLILALLLLGLTRRAGAADPAALADAVYLYRDMDHYAAVDTLYNWCGEDKRCEHAYHLDNFSEEPLRRRQIFAFFFSSWIEEFDQAQLDMASFVEQRFAFSHSGTDLSSAAQYNNSIRQHWLYYMRVAAHDNERVRCGINEQLMFSRETMDAYCACINNRNCEDGGNWRNRNSLTNGLSLFVVLLVIAHIVVRLYHYAAATSFYYRKLAELGSPAVDGKTS